MANGKIAGTSPVLIELESNKTYAWCACGKSDNQPWCNGSHQGSDLSPAVFRAEESKKAAMCMCKQSKNPPYCDGSHMHI